MKRGKTIRRAAALLLALATSLSLAACKKETAPVKVKLTNVYKSEAIPLDSSLQNVDRMTVAGDIVYFIGSSSKEENGEYKYFSALYSMNIDGTGLKKLIEMENFYDPEKQISSSHNIRNIAADNSGNLWIVEEEYYDDYSDPNQPIYENNTSMKKLNSSGDTLAEISTKELAAESDYFYVNYLAFDKTGNIFIASDRTVYVLDAQTAELKMKVEDENYINGLTSAKTGDVYVLAWSENGMLLKKVDTVKKDWGQTVELKSSNMYNLLPGSEEYDFYYQDSTAVLGYKIDTGESVEILNWINSDIDSDRINSIQALADGRIMGIEYSEDRSTVSLVMLTRKPDSEITESIVLTYATMWMGSDIRSAIIKFNRSQEEYRIQVTDYSKYSEEDWQAGYDKLNMDIISGNIPDIINLENLNVSSYINKGLLADIYPMIDEDPDISRDDFLTNILEASSQNGKLYRVIPSFGIYSVAGKTSIVGSAPGWTIDDLNSLLRGMPEGTVAFAEMRKSDILTYSTYMAMDQFINSDTGECKFNSDAFIRLLEFANGFETEIDWDALYQNEEYWMLRQDAFKEDRTLLTQTYVYGVRSVRDTKEQFGAPITYIGFPTDNKNGSCIVPQMQLGISAKSKNQEAAWQFVRNFLLEENYTNNRYFYGLPLNKHVLEDQLELEKTPMKDRPGNEGMMMAPRMAYASSGVMISDSSSSAEYEEDEYTRNYHLTDDEADQIMALITSVNQLIYSDAKISEIITAEVEYYFNGQKDARSTADIIQNKIQTYISESR